MVALNARLQLLRTGQRQQEALVDLFTALAEKARISVGLFRPAMG